MSETGQFISQKQDTLIWEGLQTFADLPGWLAAGRKPHPWEERRVRVGQLAAPAWLFPGWMVKPEESAAPGDGLYHLQKCFLIVGQDFSNGYDLNAYLS